MELPFRFSGFSTDISVAHGEGGNQELTISDLHNIAHAHIGDNEIVLAACIWYPVEYKKGKVFIELSRIDFSTSIIITNRHDLCIGNYGLLITEGPIDESQDTSIGTGGLCLFNRICGNFRITFGNCQIAPSSIWQVGFHCKPKRGNPYLWEDAYGLDVLRFERIASPIRKIDREEYFRQPILFRWVCNKSWLKTILQNKELCLIPFCFQESYPDFKH